MYIANWRSLLGGKCVVIAIAPLLLTLEQPGAVIRVNAVAVGNEQDHVSRLAGIDVLVLLLARLDGRRAVGAPAGLCARTPACKAITEMSVLLIGTGCVVAVSRKQEKKARSCAGMSRVWNHVRDHLMTLVFHVLP